MREIGEFLMRGNYEAGVDVIFGEKTIAMKYSLMELKGYLRSWRLQQNHEYFARTQTSIGAAFLTAGYKIIPV